MAENNNGVPAIMSFFIPGLGQIIKGEVGKGIVIMVVLFISVCMMLLIVGFITTPILWIWNIYDAYNDVEYVQ